MGLIKPIAHAGVAAVAVAATAAAAAVDDVDDVDVCGTRQSGGVVYLTEGYGSSAVMRSGNGMPSGVQVQHFCTYKEKPVRQSSYMGLGGGVHAVEQNGDRGSRGGVCKVIWGHKRTRKYEEK